MAEHLEETRLDLLWRVVAGSGTETDWLRFYEGFAAQRLIVPVEDGGTADIARLMTLALDSGDVALAFDTEARFATFIDAPTEFVTLTGAELAHAVAPGIGVALNPGVAPGETVLDAQALSWIAEHTGAEVTVDETPGGTRVHPPVNPEAALLDALGTRLAEMTGHVAEAWLLGTTTPQGDDAYLCVLHPAGEATGLTGEIAAQIARVGQIRTARSFSVTVAEAEARLLNAARRHGIGLAGLGAHA